MRRAESDRAVGGRGSAGQFDQFVEQRFAAGPGDCDETQNPVAGDRSRGYGVELGPDPLEVDPVGGKQFGGMVGDETAQCAAVGMIGIEPLRCKFRRRVGQDVNVGQHGEEPGDRFADLIDPDDAVAVAVERPEKCRIAIERGHRNAQGRP
ncbi:hypothetical protein SDC9_165556 [bioreactor metagenome]|uniref:Uncharacterized protein n=1 Tax=bioreactor metagenome TaxID=1076179 RepID=A0A645FUL0_9ZZZZ